MAIENTIVKTGDKIKKVVKKGGQYVSVECHDSLNKIFAIRKFHTNAD